MKRATSAALLVLTIMAVTFRGLQTEAASRHTGVFLLGATGDLARKYLWQALFDAYMRREGSDKPGDADGHQEWKMSFAAGGYSHASVAANRLKDIFDNNVKCTDSHGSLSVCTAKRGEFFDKINYFQLMSEEDFKAMCDSVASPMEKEEAGTLKEVLVYLSVPPTAFLQVLKRFKSQCTFPGQEVSFKVVLEKPQGHDRESAEQLSRDLLVLFEEEELYRTDHYLAKSVVSCILPFRAANPQLEKMLNRDYVERVEIFMKETVGVEGRHSLYNELGVIRDVFQNHLTQLLTLVTLDLPANLTLSSSIIEQAKVQLLKQVTQAASSSLLLGQYASYTFDAASEVPNTNASALVPTYAAALLKVHSTRWRDVPFLLVSGKKLDERASFIRIVFKDTNVCVSNCDSGGQHSSPGDGDVPEGSSSYHHHHHQRHHLYHLPKSHKKQVVFHIGHGPAKLPLVSVSRSLGEPQLTEQLEEMHDSDVFSAKHSYHGDHSESFYHATPANNADAYSTLIEDLLHGRRENFISTAQLLLAWRIWENVLGFNPPAPRRLYDAGDPASVLNFVLKGDSLEFAAADEKQDGKEPESPVHHLHQAQTPATFLGRRMVCDTKEALAVHLAREIEQAAESEIASKGVFHVAFSGGTTPILLWQMLSQSFASEYWAHVHVWQVDERCVRAAADTHSNLFQLDRQLLRFIAVPWSHVHAMPVDVAGRLCDPELQGDRQYADSLRHSVPNLQLDFVVLGVGADGHTASLFPHSPALNADSDTLVTLTDQGPGDTPLRMTLTLPMINRAKRIAVLATGEEKQEILERLEDSGRGGHGVVDIYPILGVNPANGTLSWFVDYPAYFGHDYYDFD